MSDMYVGTILTYVPNSLKTLTILASTTAIKADSQNDYAFKDASETIENVSFEQGCLINTIPKYCFYRCLALAYVDFSPCSSLTSIEGKSFYYCHSLKNITFPKSLSSVSNSIFSNCKIEYLEFDERTQIKQLTSSIFDILSSLSKFKIPSSIESLRGDFFC